MNVSAKDISRQQLFFTDYWGLYKKHFGMWKLSEKERFAIWEDFIADQKQLTEKYKDDDFFLFVRNLVVAMTLEFERKQGSYTDSRICANLPPKSE